MVYVHVQNVGQSTA